MRLKIRVYQVREESSFKIKIVVRLGAVTIWYYCKIFYSSGSVFINYKDSIIINLESHCIPNICSFYKIIFAIIVKPGYLAFNFLLETCYIEYVKNLFFSITSWLYFS